MYKGILNKKDNIIVEYSNNYTNSGSAILLISTSSKESDSNTIVPGGSGSVNITPSTKGTLRILLDVAKESDTGKLEVKINGKVKKGSSENVKGDTTWVYNVL